MRWVLQIVCMLSDLVIIGTVARLWYDLGKQMPLFCLILTVVAFRVWRSTGGFIAWTPSGIRAFMRNAKEMGL